METNNHIKAIDQLRGMAILLVLANHTFGYAKVSYPMPLARETSFHISDIIGFSLTAIFSNEFLGGRIQVASAIGKVGNGPGAV